MAPDVPHIPSRLREQVIHLWTRVTNDDDVVLFRDLADPGGSDADPVWIQVRSQAAMTLGIALGNSSVLKNEEGWEAEEWCRSHLRADDDETAWTLITSSVDVFWNEFRHVSHAHELATTRMLGDLSKILQENSVPYSAHAGRMERVDAAGVARLVSADRSYEEASKSIQQLLEVVCALPDPAGFPPLRFRLRREERALADRYIRAALELTESTALRARSEVTVRIPTMLDEPIVEARLPSKELTRGLVPLFRQFYSQEEHASFSRIVNLLQRVDREKPDDSSSERRDVLAAWRRTEGTLHGNWSEDIIAKHFGHPGPVGRRASPEQVISEHFYGEQLHWGRKREDLSARMKDPVHGPMDSLRFLQAMATLSHLYVAFSAVVVVALGDLNRPGLLIDAIRLDLAEQLEALEAIGHQVDLLFTNDPLGDGRFVGEEKVPVCRVLDVGGGPGTVSSGASLDLAVEAALEGARSRGWLGRPDP